MGNFNMLYKIKEFSKRLLKAKLNKYENIWTIDKTLFYKYENLLNSSENIVLYNIIDLDKHLSHDIICDFILYHYLLPP